jgi:hypothetical protein
VTEHLDRPPDPAASTPPTVTPVMPPPGWYLDPWAVGQRRYWTGSTWTADVFPDGFPDGSGAQARPMPGRLADPAARPTVASPVPPAAPQWVPPTAGTATVMPARVAPPPPQPASAPPRSERLRSAALLAAGLVVGFLAVLWVVNAVAGTSRSTRPAADRPVAPTAPVPTPIPADPAQSALAKIVVQPADVAATFTVGPVLGGRQVSGQPSLDLCGANFASESLRTARLQVSAVDTVGTEVLSTEAVRYISVDATAQAFAELRAAAAGCPTTPVASPGEPAVATRFNPAPDTAWPQVSTVERLAFDFVATDTSGETQHVIGVYLRRGRVLEGVYFLRPDGSQSPVAGQTSVADIVGVFAGRIAQLPAAVTDGP